MELKCLEDNSSVPNCLYKCLEGYEESYLDPFLSLPFYKHSYQKNVQKSLSFLRNLARESIERRKEAMESCQPHANDIMGMILQASQLDRDVSMEDLVDEFITFFVAGKYTTKSDWELMVPAVNSLPQRCRFLWGVGVGGGGVLTNK